MHILRQQPPNLIKGLLEAAKFYGKQQEGSPLLLLDIAMASLFLTPFSFLFLILTAKFLCSSISSEQTFTSGLEKKKKRTGIFAAIPWEVLHCTVPDRSCQMGAPAPTQKLSLSRNPFLYCLPAKHLCSTVKEIFVKALVNAQCGMVLIV